VEIKNELEKKVRDMIIDRLALEDVDPEKVDFDAPIFESFDAEGEGLGLDSVDALELVVGLNDEFGVKVSDEDMAIFRSIRTISDFIREKRGE
jgi:acyl carrier protein